MLHCNDVNWGGFVASDEDVKWRDDSTAPIGGGDIAPGGPIDNPNSD